MRVIANKLVFYQIDGDAEIAPGRQGDLGGQMPILPTLIKAAGELDPSVMSLVGEGQPVHGVQKPRFNRFPAPGNPLFSGGKAALASPRC